MLIILSTIFHVIALHRRDIFRSQAASSQLFFTCGINRCEPMHKSVYLGFFDVVEDILYQ